MNNPDQTTPALDALAELAAIRRYIVDIQKQLKEGRMPDMTTLEKRTADICRLIGSSSATIQQEAAPELKDLARQLDDCEKDLREFFENMIAEMSPR
jgi:uncharacterized protein YaaN involved in tellurite resistance